MVVYVINFLYNYSTFFFDEQPAFPMLSVPKNLQRRLKIVSLKNNRKVGFPEAHRWRDERVRRTYLKAAILTTRVKISTIDHFANVSSHKKMDPLREMEHHEGGRNHKQKVMSCLV